MSIRGLFQRASTIKIQLSMLVWYKADLIIISLKINLFSPWYSWKIAELTLNISRSLNLKHVYNITWNKYPYIIRWWTCSMACYIYRLMHGLFRIWPVIKPRQVICIFTALFTWQSSLFQNLVWSSWGNLNHSFAKIIGQNIWPPEAIFVSDWLCFKISSDSDPTSCSPPKFDVWPYVLENICNTKVLSNELLIYRLKFCTEIYKGNYNNPSYIFITMS